MCHQFFNDIKLGTGFQMYIIFTNCRIDSFDLSSIQRKYRIFTKINFGNGIEYTGSGAFTLSVMLFYIAYICIFFNIVAVYFWGGCCTGSVDWSCVAEFKY